MAERKPVVLVSGQLKELPAGDTLPPQTPAAHSHATSDVTGLDAALAGKEPTISAGTTAQYWRGDKTWRDFFTDVRAATLTGLSTATNAVIDAADTVLAALGKLQKQISDHFASTANAHPASAISNTPSGGIAATNVQAAINELDSEKANAASVREKLTADRTYYVRTDGNDNNNGLSNTSGGAFLTIQKAIDVATALDNGGYDIRLLLGSGTFTGANVLKPFVGSGKIIIGGVGASTVVQVSTTGGACFWLPNGAQPLTGLYDITDVKLQASVSGCYGIDLGSGQGGVVTFGGIEFGAFANGTQIRTGRGALISNVGRSYTISGGANAHAASYDGSQIRLQYASVTLSGVPAFTAFIVCSRHGNVLANANTYTGTATGKKYDLTALSYALGVSTFPGGTAGTADATSIAAG